MCGGLESVNNKQLNERIHVEPEQNAVKFVQRGGGHISPEEQFILRISLMKIFTIVHRTHP